MRQNKMLTILTQKKDNRNPKSKSDPASWLAANVAMAQPANVRLATEIILYSWWNVWKERNRWVFGARCSA
jgi:hypothetical protein